MAPVKCVGCFELQREELYRRGAPLVLYNCPRYFPFATTLSGLLRPGKRIFEAIKDCTELLDVVCIVRGCLNMELTSLGKEKFVTICRDHERAWRKWLDEHPGKREYFSPRGRAITPRWVEVFREFIEDMRSSNV